MARKPAVPQSPPALAGPPAPLPAEGGAWVAGPGGRLVRETAATSAVVPEAPLKEP